MTDPNPWASVPPAVVTSVVTTLATLGVTSTIGRLNRGKTLRERPFMIRPSSATSWSIVNRTKRLYVDFSASAQGTASDSYRTIQTGSTLYPDSEAYLGELKVGDLVSLSWVETRRGKPRIFSNTQFRVYEGTDEYIPERRDYGAGNGGGK